MRRWVVGVRGQGQLEEEEVDEEWGEDLEGGREMDNQPRGIWRK